MTRKSPTDSTRGPKRWSQRVTRESNALDLESGVFAKDDPREIAKSLKRSAERSTRRKAEPFRSAMSMLVFYINRAGKGLARSRRAKLEAAKDELRKLYGKERKPASPRARKSRAG
jgi:uncharacterized protein DUF3175